MGRPMALAGAAQRRAAGATAAGGAVSVAGSVAALPAAAADSAAAESCAAEELEGTQQFMTAALEALLAGLALPEVACKLSLVGAGWQVACCRLQAARGLTPAVASMQRSGKLPCLPTFKRGSCLPTLPGSRQDAIHQCTAGALSSLANPVVLTPVAGLGCTACCAACRRR